MVSCVQHFYTIIVKNKVPKQSKDEIPPSPGITIIVKLFTKIAQPDVH